MNTDTALPLDELARRFPDSLGAAIEDMVDSGFGALEPEEKSPATFQPRGRQGPGGRNLLKKPQSGDKP